MPNPSFDFHGKTYDRDLDGPRLNQQLDTVKLFLAVNPMRWWSPREFEEHLHPHSWCSISARLRDLRKKEFGSWTIQRRRREGITGTFEYRYVPVHDPYSKEDHE